MIELHRLSQDDDTRVAMPADRIDQIHVGKGGATVVTTKKGALVVREKYEDVVEAVEHEREKER